MDQRDPITDRRNARAAAGYVSSLMRTAARRRRAEAAGDARDPADAGGEPPDAPPARRDDAPAARGASNAVASPPWPVPDPFEKPPRLPSR